MIQRIQTLFLLIAVVLLAFLFSNPLAEIMVSDDLILILKYNRIQSVTGTEFVPVSTWPVAVLLILSVLIGFVAVFLYRNRILQMRLCVLNILLMFGLEGLIYFVTKSTLKHMNGSDSVFLWPIVLPYISIILTYLAFKKIQRDEIMVRFSGRIR